MPNLPDDPSLLLIHQLKQQCVRDLAWCCISAPMMQELSGSTTQILPFQEQRSNTGTTQSDPVLRDWLRTLDANPCALNKHLAQQKSTRLGIYYEALWQFYFSHYPQWQLLDYNLQINHKGITLGALDFLCGRNGQHFHIETAVKFYLCNTDNKKEAADWKNWIGPNNNDRLDIKLTHLINHQLPLHQFAETQKVLHEKYPHIQNWHSALCLQGYFFSPASMCFSPEHSNPHHGYGCWWHLQDFQYFLQQATQAKTMWIILEHQHWLSPAHIDNPDGLATASELAKHIQSQLEQTKKPLLVAALEEMNTITKTIWRETMRGFVVPDHWPDN
ncbi:DUF1853 family protein [Cellvibrio sp. UBA7661]|uniref:DUF1853 family protein n=1 Tax=Cellvibrio sp. UBA7661 TaxID=1946311 RepID=UPI002F350248